MILIAPALFAATFLVPHDARMIQTSDDIVVATGVSSFATRNSRGRIVTRYTLRVEETLKGDLQPGQDLVLTELGGVVGNRASIIPGSPVYRAGERYLVFTETNADFEPITFGMSVGQFALAGELALRREIHGFDQNLEPFIDRARDARRFMEYIRGIVEQRTPIEPAYFVAHEKAANVVANAEYSRGSYLMVDEHPFRWDVPTATFVKNGTQPGGDRDIAANIAYAQWNSTESNIDYHDGGDDENADAGFTAEDGKNAILFNDPNHEVPGSAAAIGGIMVAEGPHVRDGETFWYTLEGDVVVNDIPLVQSCLNTVVTHEIGHTLGFRHSNGTGNPSSPPPACDPAVQDCTSNAVMNSNVNCTFNGVLRAWDQRAAGTVYGSGPPCVVPAIERQPGDETIDAGQSAEIHVRADGSGLAYQWYVGASGDVSHPIGGNSSQLVVSPATTTTYWVRVRGECGTPADSRTATVTVRPVACVAPSIVTPPVSQTIAAGARATLSVVAAGTAQLHYAWLRGEQPVGADAAVFVSEPLFRPTTFRVRVTNACGAVESNPAVIRVKLGRRRSARK